MFSWPVTFTAAADEVKPHLNFLHHFTSKVVKLNIPRGREERLRVGGCVGVGEAEAASACFGPTDRDLVRATPTCLTS